ncbi:MAG: flippase [Patescibacteria group bacterium]|jgi:O-antigen/teichoic acid export membrane protein
MELKRKIAQNTIIQIVGKIIATLLGVMALAIMTRYLGTAGFGEYSTIITFVSFFAMSADLGLTLISAQMISNPNEDQNKILSNLFSLRLVSALILLGLAPIFVLFFPYSQIIKIGVLIAVLSYIFPALNQILIALFQKTLKMERAMIAEIIGKIFLVGTIFLAIKLNYGLNGILWASVISAGVNFLINWLFGKKSAKIKLVFDLYIWKKIIRKTWPLAVTIILNLLYQKSDIILLSLFKSIEEVGIYSSSYRTIEVIGTIPYMFAGIMLPLFTFNWINKNLDFFKKMMQKSFDFMIILALPLAIGAQFTATEVISLIAGKDFSEAGLPLQLLIISISLLFLSCIFSHIIIAIEKQKKVIALYVYTTISSLILYLILIPKFSYLGASLVTIYSNVIILAGTFYYVKKFTNFSPKLKILYRSLLSSVVMASFMFFLPRSLYQNNLSLIIIIFSSIVLYFSSLYLFKGINKEDLLIFIPKNKN